MEHKLCDALTVAQVDEDHSAQITAAMHPAHQNRTLPRVGGAQLTAGVRTAKLA